MKTKDTLEEIPQIHGRRLPKKVLDWHKKEVEKVLDEVVEILKKEQDRWMLFDDQILEIKEALSKLRKEYE